jgi:pantetheine-phosphate adenylyltransferase
MDEPRVRLIIIQVSLLNIVKKGINYLLRGLRTSADFEFERAMGQVNKSMAPDMKQSFF